MNMPETAVDEDNFAVSGKNHIGFTRKIFAMKSITIAQTVYYGTDKNLRTSILVSDLGHIIWTLFFSQDISHTIIIDTQKNLL